jgi:MFS family permease
MAKFKQSPRQQKKDYTFFLLDGVFWAIMYYISIVFLIPYLLHFGATSLQIGLLQTLPIVIASFFGLFSYSLLKYFNSKKQMVVLFAILQAFFWLPLAFAGYLFNNTFIIWLVIFLYALIQIMEYAPLPVYRDWIGKIFAKNKIVTFVARKQTIMNIISIVPLLLAGFYLDFFIDKNTTFAFTLLFIFVGFFRFASAIYLSKMSKTESRKEIITETKKMTKPVFSVFKKLVLKNKKFLYFLLVVSALYLSINIASPYYRYYFLEILNLSYTNYILIEISSILGLVFSFYYWGSISDIFGTTKVLKATVIFLPIYPLAVILLGKNILALSLLGFFDGVVLAGFTISIYGYFYQQIRSDFIHHISFFVIFQSVAVLIGSLIGGVISSNNFFWYRGIQAYGLLLIFYISFCLRTFTVIYFANLKDQDFVKDRKSISLARGIVLQAPVIFGMNRLINYISKTRTNIDRKILTTRKKIDKNLSKTRKNLSKTIKKKKFLRK